MNKVGCPAVGSWKEGRKEGRKEGEKVILTKRRQALRPYY